MYRLIRISRSNIHKLPQNLDIFNLHVFCRTKNNLDRLKVHRWFLTVYAYVHSINIVISLEIFNFSIEKHSCNWTVVSFRIDYLILKPFREFELLSCFYPSSREFPSFYVFKHSQLSNKKQSQQKLNLLFVYIFEYFIKILIKNLAS